MLIINETEYDLGNVKFGNISERLIDVSNHSNQQVAVNPIGTSCSCTTGTLLINPLPPNSTTQAKILFNSNKVGMGAHAKSFTISWLLNGNHYSHTIRFKVNVT